MGPCFKGHTGWGFREFRLFITMNHYTEGWVGERFVTPRPQVDYDKIASRFSCKCDGRGRTLTAARVCNLQQVGTWLYIGVYIKMKMKINMMNKKNNDNNNN